MLRLQVSAFLLLVVAAICVGCKGETPSLSVPSSKGLSADTLLGAWDGAFVFAKGAAFDQFTEAEVAAFKSLRIHIDFHAGGRMTMQATMKVPEADEQTNNVQGTWEFVRAEGQSMVIRSTEEDGEPEEATLNFRGPNDFEMEAPQQLRKLGVMRFTRQR